VVEIVVVKSGGVVEAGMPRVLFAGSFATSRVGDQSYELGPDGRFLMLRLMSGRRIDLHVTLNWIDEVRARLADAQ
jgi:hypothetical protein